MLSEALRGEAFAAAAKERTIYFLSLETIKRLSISVATTIGRAVIGTISLAVVAPPF